MNVKKPTCPPTFLLVLNKYSVFKLILMYKIWPRWGVNMSEFKLRKRGGGGIALYPKYVPIVMKIGMKLGF
jgi:hypothetical protein